MIERTNELPSETEQDAALQVQKNLGDLPVWISPELEDVSEQVMAQPYIRFT